MIGYNFALFELLFFK